MQSFLLLIPGYFRCQLTERWAVNVLADQSFDANVSNLSFHRQLLSLFAKVLVLGVSEAWHVSGMNPAGGVSELVGRGEYIHK